MAKKPSKDELRYGLYYRMADHGARIMTTGIWAVAVCFCAFYFYKAVDSLAGESTVADIVVAMTGRFDVTKALLTMLAGGGVIYGVRQRKLKADHTERLSNRNAELEQRMDPNRTSSRLTIRGETRPEDRL